MKQGFRKVFDQYARIASLVLVAWFSIGPAGRATAKSHKGADRPVIRVGIYNYAEVAPQELRDAEHHVTRLMEEAGVKITWLHYTPKQRSLRGRSINPAADFFVRILFSSTMKGPMQTAEKDAMGQTFVPPGIEGPAAARFANVFYDRVQTFTPPPGPCSKEVLGDVIAHELGHLLLGPRHSRHGIMKAVWALKEMELITCCRLRFSEGQTTEIQQAARSLEGDSSPVVAARR